jgi:hypothetical protein
VGAAVAATGSASFANTLLVTLHGAKSTSLGMHALSTFCGKELPGLNTYILNYGDVGIRQVINDPNIREFIYTTVAYGFRGLSDKVRSGSEYPSGTNTRIVVVAQSLGTLAIYEYLRRIRNPHLLIHQLILVGSILQPRIEWDVLTEPPPLLASPPINFARPFDLIARQAYRITNERTTSGTRGFSPAGRHTAINAFKRGGHTSYNPDDFGDIRDIIADNGWAPACPTEASFFPTLTRVERIRLGMYRTAGLC